MFIKKSEETIGDVELWENDEQFIASWGFTFSDNDIDRFNAILQEACEYSVTMGIKLQTEAFKKQFNIK